MLTGDLVRIRTYKKQLRPSWLTQEDAGEDARWLCGLFAEKMHCTRGELDEVVASESQIRPDHKVLKGLYKLLCDRATFETEAAIPPAELRERVFLAAASAGPLAYGPDPFGRPTATQILEEIGAELGLSADAVLEGLYADRKQEQRLNHLKEIGPEGLVHRYNVALVQSALLRATQVRIELPDPPAARVRQLLRYVKFHQLLHRGHRDGEILHLHLDGPESVLKQSTRYGMRLATFFPALLLHERFTLTADVRWKKRLCTLTLTQDQGLVSHYTDRGGYTPREATWFADRFAEVDTKWKLSEGEEPLWLGDQVVMPDFTLKKGRKKVHLEILGTWKRATVEKRLAALKRGSHLILAVSKRLVADDSTLDGLPVVPFAEVIPVKKVLAAAEACGR